MKIKISRGCSQAKVELIDFPENPYKEVLGAIWNDLSPKERFETFKKKLTTGDSSLSKPRFTFKVEGLPRHQFAQHVRARIGTTFNYEDPQTKPGHYVPYSPVYDRMFVGWKEGSEVGGFHEDPAFSVEVDAEGSDLKHTAIDGTFTAVTEFGKSVSEQLMEIPEGDWKVLRDHLPLCYEQPYTFEIEYRALIGQCSRRLCLGEEAHIVANHYLQKAAVYEKFPLLATVLQSSCLRVKKCLYSKNYTLSNAFGCLFSGCNYRLPAGSDYATFNKSCSDIETLRQEIQPEGIVDAMDSITMPQTFEELSDLDKGHFE